MAKRRRYRPLWMDLEELERTNPEVREAAERLERTMWWIPRAPKVEIIYDLTKCPWCGEPLPCELHIEGFKPGE